MLSVEVWESSDNRAEKHYFLKDGSRHGYQDGRYLLGLNPQIVPPAVEQQILKLLEPIWRGLVIE